ncbi:MAG TPA: flagellar motor protein MotA, partial [Aestuariivirgaceae bacterium]|nr:flagellar motor protein MotA [Aestuariivirgaceae bacterium]
AVLFPTIRSSFMHNPGLNGFIGLVLLFGIAHAFRQVVRLFPEVNWINSFRIADPGLEVPHQPRLLAPMAALLRDRQGMTVLSPLTLRSLLDSLASRLDEGRDLLRYLIGLLIFLGLLGTFWGLLDTVSSVGSAIQALDVTATEQGTIFDELKAGLAAPLAGMGTSFSSSLFGLAASLVMGFLDLQTNQAQNRFYNDLENWLSTITDIEAGEGSSQMSVPHYLRLDLRDLQGGIDRINKTLTDALSDATSQVQINNDNSDPEALDKLAGAVQGLVQQMREEQKIVRQWAQAQTVQQEELKDLMSKLNRSPAAHEVRASRAHAREE